MYLNANEQNIINKLTLSKMMEQELEQIFAYLRSAVFEESETVLKGIADNFYDRYGKPANGRECYSKEETKKVLKGIRNDVLKELASFSNRTVDRQGAENEKYFFESENYEACKKHEKVIYVEEKIKDYELTKQLVGKFGGDVCGKSLNDDLNGSENENNRTTTAVEYTKHYKDVFDAKGHEFIKEKKSGSVILAENKDKLLLPGAPFCQSFGNEHFYYASLVKNCVFDCEYCFLQGLYPSGMLVIFVNIDDYLKELSEKLENERVYLCPSYDTDLMAFENTLHYVEKLCLFAKLNPNLRIEIRTKTANPHFFDKMAEVLKNTEVDDDSLQGGLLDNVYFAWTLSPENITQKYEHGLPDSKQRIACMKKAAALGFKVRACFDPMIFCEGWKEKYDELFDYFFQQIDIDKELSDMSVGVFRISNNLLKRMRNVRPHSPITQFPYVTENGASHYGDITKEMISFAKECILKYCGSDGEKFLADKVFFWEGNE